MTEPQTLCYFSKHQHGRTATAMDEKNYLFAIRHKDGSVTLYVDEAYAEERGIDPGKLTRVEIPKDLYISGTVQQVREYVATYLESLETGHAQA